METNHTLDIFDHQDVNRCPGCTKRFSELERGHDVQRCMIIVANRHVWMYGGGRGVDAMKQRSQELQKEVGFRA